MNEGGIYALLCRQLSVIMRANISPLNALKICSDQIENKKLKKIVVQLAGDLSGGDKLSDAMKQHGDRFPEIAISAMEGAEKSGEWEKALQSLADYFEMQARLRESDRRSTWIPALTAVLCVGLLAVITLQVVPRFLGMFNGITYELPGITKRVLAVSTFIGAQGKYILAVLLGLVLLRLLFMLTRFGKSFHATLKMHLPLTGPVNKSRLNAQFCKALSTLLKNGMPMQEAVRVMEDSVGGNERVRGELQAVSEQVASGMSLSNALKESSSFSPMILQMISIGEESGTLPSILDDMADYFERNMKLKAHRKAVILETFFVLVLGIVMCIAVTAMVQPMMEFYDMVSWM